MRHMYLHISWLCPPSNSLRRGTYSVILIIFEMVSNNLSYRCSPYVLLISSSLKGHLKYPSSPYLLLISLSLIICSGELLELCVLVTQFIIFNGLPGNNKHCDKHWTRIENVIFMLGLMSISDRKQVEYNKYIIHDFI